MRFASLLRAQQKVLATLQRISTTIRQELRQEQLTNSLFQSKNRIIKDQHFFLNGVDRYLSRRRYNETKNSSFGLLLCKIWLKKKCSSKCTLTISDKDGRLLGLRRSKIKALKLIFGMITRNFADLFLSTAFPGVASLFLFFYFFNYVH